MTHMNGVPRLLQVKYIINLGSYILNHIVDQMPVEGQLSIFVLDGHDEWMHGHLILLVTARIMSVVLLQKLTVVLLAWTVHILDVL